MITLPRTRIYKVQSTKLGGGGGDEEEEEGEEDDDEEEEEVKGSA
jgi:hypothetical protein